MKKKKNFCYHYLECTTRAIAAAALVVRRPALLPPIYEWMHAVPATAGHSFGVGCLHPVLDGGQEPLEAKVREGRHTLV